MVCHTVTTEDEVEEISLVEVYGGGTILVIDVYGGGEMILLVEVGGGGRTVLVEVGGGGGRVVVLEDTRVVTETDVGFEVQVCL